MSSLRPWLLALRPKTLSAAAAPIVVATGVVIFENENVRPWTAVLALLASFFIQIATNLFNDALDFEKGADSETRQGPLRVTQSGMLSARTVKIGGAVFFALAAICGVPLVIAGGWPIAVIGIVSIVCGYLYTGGPFPLAYRGLGDLFVLIFFGFVAILGMAYLHSGKWLSTAWLAGFQVGCLATALIAINNLRDRSEDAKVNKKTLAVRLGERASKIEIVLLLVAPAIAGIVWWQMGALNPFIYPLTSLVISIPLCRDILKTTPGPRYNVFLARAAAHQMIFAFLLTVGLIAEATF